MSPHSDNNRRIALNTLLLYGRMGFSMAVGFFTTRALLGALGMVDFGLVNVIAGVVTLFGFLSGSMSGATGRFFSFELGRGDYEKLAATFGVTRLVYAVLAFIILILSEVVGSWMISHKLVIPPDRLDAARWLFHGALFAFILGILNIPYSALAIARENMRLYSSVSMIESTLRLFLVLSLPFVPRDRLASYGALLFITAAFVYASYRISCRRLYPEARAAFRYDPVRFKELISFSGWNLFGALSVVANGALTNILLNLFFGPVVNAARGVAYQVSGAVSGLSAGFMQAGAPQIVKYYAAGEYDAMRKLVCDASRYGFFLLLIGILPFIISAEAILGIWIHDVPEGAVLFTRLTLVAALIDCLSAPFMSALQATGRIALYQATVGSILMANLPISYLLLRAEFPASSVFCVTIISSIVCLAARLHFLSCQVGLCRRDVVWSIFYPLVKVALPLVMVAMAGRLLLSDQIAFAGLTAAVIMETFLILSIYLFGLSQSERGGVKSLARRFFKNENHKKSC